MSKTFIYKAKTPSGENIGGTIVADSATVVAAFIREKGYFITGISEKKTRMSLNDILNNYKSVPLKDLAVFCRLFATMVGAGISFIQSLSILQEQTENHRLKNALSEIYKKVREGESLAKSMREFDNIFPQLMIGMIDAGEAGGALEQILLRLAELFEKEHKVKGKIKSAMTYPITVICIAILAVGFILTFVLPTFLDMFTKMKMDLPLPTRILMFVSESLQHYWAVIVLLMILVGVAMSFLYKRPDIRLKVDSNIFRVPVFGMLMKKVTISRFAYTLSTLLHSGMPIILALDMVKRAMTNLRMVKVLEEAETSVKGGASLTVPLANSKIFTPMVVNMVSIGEESGELDRMLQKVADFYENEVDDMVSRLSSLIEPFLIVFLGVVIGGIVLSVMIPMIEITTNVGK